MVLAKDQNIFLASLPSAGQVDVVVEHVILDFSVVVDTLVVDKVVVAGKLIVDMVVTTEMVVYMARARLKQLDGKARQHMVVLYFPLLPLWNWSDLLASLGGQNMISSLHLRHWQHMATFLSSPGSQFVLQQK